MKRPGARSRSLVLAAVAAAAAGAGCFGGDSAFPLRSSCSEERPCAWPTVCAYGRCRSPCTFDADCPDGASCVASSSGDGSRVCTFPDEGCDQPGNECPDGLYCSPIDHNCHEPCVTDDDCDGDRICRGGLCVEPDPECNHDGYCTEPPELWDTCDDCGPVCGNLLCLPPEDPLSCACDCDLDHCGNGACDAACEDWSCPDCQGQPICGDGACDEGEDAGTCECDCDSGHCGNGACDRRCEDETCPDCQVEPLCGDGDCGDDEDALSCPRDCPPVCGDGLCTHDEVFETCPEDCETVCPDGVCTGGETAVTCPDDCPPVCGDGACTHTETAASCPDECPAVCSDGACTHTESAVSCPADCPAFCGDGACTHAETYSGCPADCTPVCGNAVCERPAEHDTPCWLDCGAVTRIVAGGNHTCALFENGRVKCWGRNDNGQLGYGNTDPVGLTNVPADVDAVEIGAPVTQLAAGFAHTCALLEGGTVRCWGDDSSGQLGYGDGTDGSFGDDPGEWPSTLGDIRRSDGVTLDSVISIAAGQTTTCAIVSDGSTSSGAVYCWGTNLHGQLGCGACGDLDRPSPSPIVLPENAVSVVSGAFHTCATGESGSLFCWGWDLFGQLGNGPAGDTMAPTDPPVLAAAHAATAKNMHTCALDTGGAVSCWGNNSAGEVGDGRCDSSMSSPYTVIASGVTGLGSGDSFNCVILEPGGVYDGVACWGAGRDGQLGYAEPIERCAPAPDPSGVGFETVRVEGVGDEVTAIVGGAGHACVLLARGAVRCWGSNGFGQLGYGRPDNIGDGEHPYTADDVDLF